MRRLQTLNYFAYSISEILHYLPVQLFLHTVIRRHVFLIDVLELVKLSIQHLYRKEPRLVQIRGRILVDIRAFYLLIRHYRKLTVVAALKLYFRTRQYAIIRYSIKKLEIQLIPGKLTYTSVISTSVCRNVRTAYAKRHVILAVHGVLPTHNITVFISLAVSDLYVVLREFGHIVVFHSGKIRLRKTLYIDDTSSFPVDIRLYAIGLNLNGISPRHITVKPLLMKRAFKHSRFQHRRLCKHIRVALYLAIPNRVRRQLWQIYIFALLRDVRVKRLQCTLSILVSCLDVYVYHVVHRINYVHRRVFAGIYTGQNTHYVQSAVYTVVTFLCPTVRQIKIQHESAVNMHAALVEILDFLDTLLIGTRRIKTYIPSMPVRQFAVIALLLVQKNVLRRRKRSNSVVSILIYRRIGRTGPELLREKFGLKPFTVSLFRNYIRAQHRQRRTDHVLNHVFQYSRTYFIFYAIPIALNISKISYIA